MHRWMFHFVIRKTDTETNASESLSMATKKSKKANKISDAIKSMDFQWMSNIVSTFCLLNWSEWASRRPYAHASIHYNQLNRNKTVTESIHENKMIIKRHKRRRPNYIRRITNKTDRERKKRESFDSYCQWLNWTAMYSVLNVYIDNWSIPSK